MALLARMNATQKIDLLHGCCKASRWRATNYTGQTLPQPLLGIPALRLNDGRQGFNSADNTRLATAWPCQLAVVSGWDKSAMFAFGAAMATEFGGKGANLMLAPMLILARVPQGGRNFESIGEDPELAYHLAFAHVSGVQSVPGVMANADDFVLNNQETSRDSVSSECDQRTLFEMYYRGYKGAIDAGVASIMCSYNKINMTYSCENPVTLGDLKNPRGLNFSGFVLSDWEGTHSTVAAALSGLDMEMPNADFFGPSLVVAAAAGAVPPSRLDDMALRVLTPMFRAGLFDGPAPNGREDANVTSAQHSALARSLAAAGTVLLQNRAGVLPLTAAPAVKTLLVLGDACGPAPQCCGTGSGAVLPPYVVTPLQGIAARAARAGVANVTFAPTPVAGAMNATAAAAAAFDAVVLCLSSPSGEGADRPSLALAPGDDALAAAVAAAQPRTVVALQVPGATLLPWAPAAGAVLVTWFAGQEMGNALADILWGDVNPSGRLPVTFPAREADGPLQAPQQYPGVNGTAVYSEKLLIGYRWWDAAGVAPRFPFGHGLSYTAFAYSGLTVDATSAAPAVLVSFSVQNTGAVAGREVVQLYLAFPASAGEPPLVLRDFAALPLAPGETTLVHFTLDQRAYSVWSVADYAWQPVSGGTYGVSVGASSRDIRLTGSFTIAA